MSLKLNNTLRILLDRRYSWSIWITMSLAFLSSSGIYYVVNDYKSLMVDYAKEKTEAKISLVRIENGILIVNDGRYHVGDRIEMTSEYTGETFHGTLTSMNSCEMYCRLMDGSKARIYLKHLRNGRVTVVAENAFR